MSFFQDVSTVIDASSLVYLQKDKSSIFIFPIFITFVQGTFFSTQCFYSCSYWYISLFYVCRYSRDFESEFGDSDHLINKSSSNHEGNTSTEELVRNRMDNLVLGPILPESELDTTDRSQYVNI